jgi:GTP-binding protein EngB required for normal cell division
MCKVYEVGKEVACLCHYISVNVRVLCTKCDKLEVVGADNTKVFSWWWRLWIIMWSIKMGSHTYKLVSSFKNW